MHAQAASPVSRFQLVECGEPLRLATGLAPEPQGTEVLLRVLAAGVCHTDLHLSAGYFDMGRGRKVLQADRGITLPHTLGHECVGEVVAVGPRATGMAIGERVLVYPWIGCDDCRQCEEGRGHLCTRPRFLGVFRPGGFSSHLLVPDARYLFPLLGLAPDRAAPLACSGLTAFSALRKAGDAPKRGSLGIIGSGGLGLMALALLPAMGGHAAIVIEPGADKRDAALQLGARTACDPSDLQAIKLVGDGLDAVIDFVGSPESVTQGMELLAKGGRLIVVGMFGGEIAFPIPSLVLRSTAIEGSYVGSLAEMGELMKLVREHGMPALPITRRPLCEVNEALLAMREGTVIGRTVLEPSPA